MTVCIIDSCALIRTKIGSRMFFVMGKKKAARNRGQILPRRLSVHDAAACKTVDDMWLCKFV